MVNPTFDVVVKPVSLSEVLGDEGEAPIIGYCRSRSLTEAGGDGSNATQVVARELTLTEAAILDAVKESFRLRVDHLQASLSVDPDSSFEQALTALYRDGFLLRARRA
jgi:hypothetical protein